MHAAWSQRVAHYVEELAGTAVAINEILDETRVGTTSMKTEEVNRSTAELAAAIDTLEELISQREKLLRDEDAPERGFSLSEKLLHSRRIEDARLAKRCGEVAQAIQDAHHRAVALFVCQHHLAQLQPELLQRLGALDFTTTYQPPGEANRRPPRRDEGGRLFNEAA